MEQTYRHRKALKPLGDETLRDIGMSRAQLLYKVAKPLWHFLLFGRKEPSAAGPLIELCGRARPINADSETGPE